MEKCDKEAIKAQWRDGYKKKMMRWGEREIKREIKLEKWEQAPRKGQVVGDGWGEKCVF